MDFLFFNAAGQILFTRQDAESASVTHEEMSLQALFPYDGTKEILRGMRIGYTDSLGVSQVYEIRKVKTLEPDHYQQLTAENIAISELTDEFCNKAEITNKTASQALSPLLTGTGWAIGTDTTSNTSSGDIAVGDVWNATRTIQQNWNVYILPRVTVAASGITGKYLDIIPAGGTWRGFRLSLDKNANEIGVIWDDSNLKTALYGFGQEKNGSPLTFKDVVWSQTSSHPAKPANQTYLEDPAATTAYGRNGRPRFGYYQNASITNATTLLEKTWEVLKTVEVPDVTVDATISDLHRLGYVDVPIRLHDTAHIEVRPTGVTLQKEIIQYTEDLLDPLQSRVTIGVYIPNIIYINRKANRRGGGGRGSGSSQDWLEYTTENNTVQITVDSNGLNSLCVGTGAQLNPDGSLVVDPVTGKPVFIDTGDTMWSQITQNKQNITLKVSKGDVATQLEVECGNVHITGTAGAANLVVDGYVLASELSSDIALIEEVRVQDLDVNGDASVGGDLTVFGDMSVALANTLTCGGVDCNGLDCTSIAFNGGTAYSSILVNATVDANTNTLTITKSDGTSVNFSKAASGTITGITQRQIAAYSQTDKEYTVYATASGTDITNSPYDAQIFVSGSAAYNHGFTVAEAQYTLATVHLQGTAGTVYIEDSENGTSYYQRGSLFTAQGSTHAAITPIGTPYYYQVHAASETPTGPYYTRTSSPPSGSYITHYTAGSQITGLRNAGTTQYYAVNTSSKIVIKTATRYTAGSTVTNTYYTKS